MQKLLSAAGCAEDVFQSRGNWSNKSYRKFNDFTEVKRLFSVVSETKDMTAEAITNHYLLKDSEWETTWNGITKNGAGRGKLLGSM
jgi:hypothetical protein